MEKNNYDIAIVGGGPAGSMTAKAAAENGADVIVLDKRRELGVPVQCGEALNEEVLNELGIELESRWAVNKIDKSKLVAPSGQSVILEQKSSPKDGYILDRKVFDKHLATLAGREGAEIQTRTYVDGVLKEDGKPVGVSYRGSGDDTEIFADVIVAADGVMSRVARWAGFDTALSLNNIESGIQFKMVNIDVEEKNMMEFYFGDDIAPGGYVWVFPRGEDKANVGIGVLPSEADQDAIKYLEKFVSNKPELQDGHIVEINTGGVPVSGPLEKTYGDNFLIVGDAARQVNAMTGGGIDWSMRAGNIAGEVAARAVEEGDTSEENLKEYQDRWRERMGDELEGYYQGKEIMLDFTDEDLNEIAESLQDVDFDEISLSKLLLSIMEVKPEIMEKLEGFL